MKNIKEGTYPGNKDCDENDENFIAVKHIDVNKIRYILIFRFDKGPANYFFDILEVALKEDFKNDILGAFTNYISKSGDNDYLTKEGVDAEKLKEYLEGDSSNPLAVVNRPGIDEKGLTEVYKDIGFKQLKPENLIKVYAEKDAKKLSFR